MTTKNEAMAALMRMFSCFNFSGDQEAKESKLDAYWSVIGDLPPEKIVDVCLKAARGEIGDGKFAPSAAELYQAACPRTGAKKKDKPSPDWRPHQDRFLASDGTLYVSEGGRTLVYKADELREWGYALPAPAPVLNRGLLIERGVVPIKRIEPASAAKDGSSSDNAGIKLIAEAAKKATIASGTTTFAAKNDEQ